MSYKTVLGTLCLNFGVVAVIVTAIYLVGRVFSLPVSMEECFKYGVFVVLFVVYPLVYGMVDSARKSK